MGPASPGRRAPRFDLSANDGSDRFGHFTQEAEASRQGAAIAIGAGIGLRVYELVDQIAVGPMNFHPIESGFMTIRFGRSRAPSL